MNRRTGAGAAQVRGAAARPGGSGAVPPYCNTGGKSPELPELAIIDYLRFTFLPYASVSASLEQLAKYFTLWFSVPVNLVPADSGLYAYESSHNVMAWVNGEMLRLAIVACGGGSTGGTMMVDMTGLGCSMVADWRAVYATMQDIEARITRVDTALDLMQGYTLEYFDELYRSGQFNCGGRIPSRRYHESGNSQDLASGGRTMYLGKKINGKELCIYEKGKQLGNAESEWVRVEIRFGNRDRVIPHEVVLEPTKYFSGAFVALQALVDRAGEKILTDRREIADEEYDISLARLLHYCKASYGNLLYLLAQDCQGDFAAFVESVAVKGVPKRLHKAVAARRATMESADEGVHGAAAS